MKKCPTCGGFGYLYQTPTDVDGSVIKANNIRAILFWGKINLYKFTCQTCEGKKQIKDKNGIKKRGTNPKK
jgi:hypothetical protein